MPRPMSLPSVIEPPGNGDPEQEYQTDNDGPDTDSSLDSIQHDAYVPSDISSDSDSCDDNREKKQKRPCGLSYNR